MTDIEKDKTLKRLRRVEGQVRGLHKMVEEGRTCQEVLTLLSGIRGALDSVGDLVLECYISESVDKKTKTQSKGIIEAVRLIRH